MASNSGWTLGLPSGQSKVSNTDEEFRSIKSYVEKWVEQEHYATGGSATSAGVHRVGSARIYSGPTSQLSNPTGDGGNRLFFTTDTERLYVAQASSSSWSLVADNIKTTSANSWSGVNSFLTNKFAVLGAFSAIVSHTSANASHRTIANGAALNLLFVNDSGLTQSDVVLSSFTYQGTHPVWSSFVDVSTGSIGLNIYNTNSGGNTIIRVGTTFRFLGFRANP